MTAEKLTKARLVQICIIFSVLLTAFTWRTFQHEAIQESQTVCHLTKPCTIELNKEKVNLLFLRIKENELRVSIESSGVFKQESLSINSNVIQTKNYNPNNREWIIKTTEMVNQSNWVISESKNGQTYPIKLLIKE